MKKALLILSFLSFMINSMAQNVNIGTNVSIGKNDPAPSAALDVNSTTKGFLPPRMTAAQRDSIVAPTAGLIIWCTNCGSSGELQVYNGTTWTNMVGGTASTPYSFVTIGTQKWMSKNLDVTAYRNGDPIPQVTDPTTWASLTSGAWCYDSSQGNKYGKLYNWYAVNDPRGLAPEGWHIPSNGEWTTLSTTLGGDLVAGGKMKEAGSANWCCQNAGATDSSGFTGLPGGYRKSDGTFYKTPGHFAYFWSATESSSPIQQTAWIRSLSYANAKLTTSPNFKKTHGMSVRCIRD
ncbi:MAG: fibrobacter succinogenes major paralogous domain-containing protein [Chitinophagaceae bacterium]|nr:fibrobacter succinogenes major paralogous domain-containing protein [Chitinophagaceae bacterium]